MAAQREAETQISKLLTQVLVVAGQGDNLGNPERERNAKRKLRARARARGAGKPQRASVSMLLRAHTPPEHITHTHIQTHPHPHYQIYELEQVLERFSGDAAAHALLQSRM